MWKEKISLNEAVDLSYNAKHTESLSKSRWTETLYFVIAWENSPTGFAAFSYESPLTNETMGIFDVNYNDEVELTAVKPVEVTTIKWEPVKD